MRNSAPKSQAMTIALAVGMTCGVAQAQVLVATVPSGPNPGQVAVNQTTNMVYVADNDVATLTVINGATNTATTIPVGSALAGVAVNPATNTIYALNAGSPGSVTVINGAGNAITTTIQLPHLATYIAVNPVTNKVYVVTVNQIGNGATGNVAVIDGSTNSITATLPMPALVAHMAVDTVRNVTYVIYSVGSGNFNSSTLAAIDGATNTITTIGVGINDTFFALNQTTNTLYVPDLHFNQLYVVSGATDTVTATIAWPDNLYGFGLAINPVTNTIYVPATNSSGPLVDVMNGSTNTITAGIPVSTFLSSPGLLVNSVTNKIWDISSPVLIIDGATSAVTTVTGTTGSQEAAVLNTTTNYGYVAELNDVLVIGPATAVPVFSASPSPLAFGNQTQGTTSGAMALTVANTGTSNLTLTTVTLAGTNMADFIITADNCVSATIAANGSCTVSVEFKPSTASSETATLAFADNASGSPQTVTLTGTGVAPPATYVVNATTPSATIQPGGVAQFNLNIASLGGTYSNLVTLSATGLPAGATVLFAPAAVTPGSAGASSVMSIQTTTGLARLATPPQRARPGPLLALLAGLPLLGLARGRHRLRRYSQRSMLLGLAALAVLSALAIAGCTGSGGYFGPNPQAYTITVTGTSGSLVESTTVSLTVR